MSGIIKVAAVSYLNTKPLLYGIERSTALSQMELLLDYPSNLAKSLLAGAIDMALLPVAAMPSVPGARIVSDYGIAADGDVASVAIFSERTIDEIETVYLDYQSRSSVCLAQLLLKEFWKKNVAFEPAPEDYITRISGTAAGVIIGDRALQQRAHFPFIYDLAGAWKSFTGLPFVFAAWVANKDLPEDFLQAFNAANAEGLKHLEEVAAENPFPDYDLSTYYTKNIHYHLDEKKQRGLELFLKYIHQP